MRKNLALILIAFLINISMHALETSDQVKPSVPSTAIFHPDPHSVQRFGPAYRYPQAGWIVLHIEGEPYERGVQHGRLLSIEIAKQVECLAALASSKTPGDGWRLMRTTVNAVFVRKFDPEYLQEMQGIADGAAAAGAKFDGRPVDLVDIVALNVWAEIMTLDGALHATPTGLEGIRFPDAQPKPPPPSQGEHCSSFIANGKATADGKIVFGHISMYDLYPSSFFNVWIDITPSKGYRILMQSIPGSIQSGLDYYITSAGLLVSETTINQTRFDPNGQTLTSQIRKAVQYSDSIDSFVATLEKGGNGLYSNEWLIGDTKTNEIAMFELGTQKSRLFRSGKNDWYGGTEGFYWGDNNVKDRAVKLETLASVHEHPVNVIYHPKERDRLWYELYQKHKGKIDASVGREFLNTPMIAMTTSADAKVTTTDDSKQFLTWAAFGPPLGRTWQPSQDEHMRYPAIHPMVSGPWTQINGFPPPPPAAGSAAEPLAVDLGGKRHEEGGGFDAKSTKPAWHGTLLAKTDADLWLATAFADYERMFSQERERAESASDHCLCAADKQKSIQTIFGARSKYLIAARSTGDVPLLEIKTTPVNDDWYRICSGKGLLLLHELRAVMGDKLFAESMDTFGTQHAGQEVVTADFVAHMQKASGKDIKSFFDFWLTKKGLPKLKLVSAVMSPSADAPGKSFSVEGVLSVEDGPIPESLEVTIETAKGEITRSVHPNVADGKFSVSLTDKPLRLIVDKYSRSAIANGAMYSMDSFMMGWEKTLIVYGAEDESAANAEAARELQTALINRGPNITVPIRADRDLSDDDLRTHNLLLIGRPDCNTISRKFANAVGVAFGLRSFKVGNDLYAHACSAVAAVAANPRERRNSIVIIAGLSPAATYAAAIAFGRGEMHGDTAVLDGTGASASGGIGGGKIRSYVMPAAGLQIKFDAK